MNELQMKYQNQNFVAYARVSTPDQAERGSHRTQIMQFKEWQLDTGANIIKTFIDDGKHGWDMERPEFLQMLDYLKKKEVFGLLIQHQDRFSRDDAIKTINLIDAILETEKVIFVIMKNKEIKLDTLGNKLEVFVEALMAEDKIKTGNEKIRLGIKRYRQENDGRWGPRGKEFDSELYLFLRHQGHSKAQCARKMNMSRKTLNKKLKQYNINDFSEFRTKKIAIEGE